MWRGWCLIIPQGLPNDLTLKVYNNGYCIDQPGKKQLTHLKMSHQLGLN